MKYIDADKLIAEIERLLKCTEPHRGDAVADGSRQTLYWIKDFITSLQQEQSEVDLEKEIEDWKPSEEQMKALWDIYQGGEAQVPIASLYEDLKKL